MAQHFLLSLACRTLSETKVARLSEDEARDVFKELRWASTGGEAVCPRCGCELLRPASSSEMALQVVQLRLLSDFRHRIR